MASNKTLHKSIERSLKRLNGLLNRKRYTKTQKGWEAATERIQQEESKILLLQQQIQFNNLENKNE